MGELKLKLKLKLNRHIMRVASTFVVSCIVIVSVLFYAYIGIEVAPVILDLWVGSAMNTMNHKWLATAFIPDAVIADIMERNLVDDSNYATNTDLVGLSTTVSKTDVGKTDVAKTDMDVIETVTEVSSTEGTLNVEVLSVTKDTYIETGYTLVEEGLYKKEVSGTGWKGYIMLVTDASRVSLTDTKYQYTKGQTVKTMVANSGAVAGINAGGFNDGANYDSNGGVPAGLLIVNNEVISGKDNSITRSMIGFNQDNKLVLGKMTAQEALSVGIRDCVDFKPFLIVNGEKVIKNGTGGWGIAPRTAVGQRQTGEVLFFCVDGRQVHSIGVDLDVLQNTLYDEGCLNAAMMDGGSSTVMVYNNEFVNKPSLGHERFINNAWVIK